MRIPNINTVYNADGSILRYDVSIDSQLADGSTFSANVRINPEDFDLSPLEAKIHEVLSKILNSEE